MNDILRIARLRIALQRAFLRRAILRVIQLFSEPPKISRYSHPRSPIQTPALV